jgi:hypothetical protein
VSKDLPIAVYFVGAEGTGKTTLARMTDAMLRRNGFKLKSMIAEVARAVQARREMDIAAMRAKVSEVNSYQREVFRRQYASERKRGFMGYVADRSLIDNLCYQAEYGTALADLLDAERAALEDYLPRLRASVVFHVTPQRVIYESSKQVDGVRAVVGYDGMLRIDAMLKLLLKLHRVRVHLVQSALASERDDQVRAVLSDRLSTDLH